MASTINPSTIDPTKPEEGQALTANVRANEAATQDNFTAAVNDIEALQADKADQTALDAHIGTGGAAHADATQSVDGFMTAADKSKLDGVATDANDYTHPAHTGDVTSTLPNGDGALTIATNAVTATKINAGAVTSAKIADGAVTADKLADMAGGTFKGRQISSGDPQDLRVENLTNQTSPVATTALLAQDAGGALVKVEVGNLPTGAGGGGSVTTATDGVNTSTGRTIFEFIGTGDATVAVADDPPNNKAVITINASAGAGGGGVQSGTPFTQGELVAVETTVGDGTIESVGILPADVQVRIPAPTLDNLVAMDGAGIIKDSGVSAADLVPGTEFADDVFRINDDATPTKQFAFEVGAVTAGQTRVMTIPDQDLDMTPGTAGTFAGIRTVNEFLESVTVNGQTVRNIPLRVSSAFATSNYSPRIRLINQDNAASGPDAGPAIDFIARDSAGADQEATQIATDLLDGTSGAFDACIMLRTNSGVGLTDRVAIHEGIVVEGAAGGDLGAGTINAFEYYKNGVVLGDGDVSKVDTPVDDQIAVWTGDGTVEGTTGLEYADRAKLSVEGAAVISTLKNAEPGGEQVYADSNGQLFTVAPPEQAWSDSATDTGIYGPQSGNTLGPWVQIPGLALTVGGDITPGDRIDLAYRIEMIENGGHAGVVDVGFGIGVGVEPIPGDFEPHVVPADFAAAISGHQSSVNETLSNGQAISLWFRIQSGTNPNFSVTANGAVSDHESFIASPAKGVGTGGTASEQHTWAVQGDISDGTLPGMFVMKGTLETLNATRLRTILTAGTCTVQLNKNGTPIATATSSVTGTADLVDFTDETLADGDLLTITVSGAASAQNLSVSLELVRES